MTKITILFGQGGYSIKSVGHAGTKESCVAVSAIIQALAGWVYNGSGGTISLDKGEALIEFPDCPGADAVMEMTVIGLMQIEKAAPQDIHVEITTEE